MNSLGPILTVLAKTPTSPADKAAKNAKQEEYLQQFWIFLGTGIGLAIVYHASCIILSALSSTNGIERSQNNSQTDLEKRRTSRNRSGLISRVQSFFATLLRVLLLRTTVPIGFQAVASVFELVVLCVYLVAIFVWILVDTRDLKTLFWEDRAAAFGTTQISIIVALAGKNSIMTLLTGISHEKLNVFHRAAGRTCFILLWMHALARLVPGVSLSSWSQDWYIAGAISLGGLSILTILSLRIVRQALFEFFLVSHIFAVLVFLVAGYYHLRKPKVEYYIWPGLMIWALDRMLRVIRLLWTNRTKNSPETMATIQIASSDSVLLTLRRKMTWKPGQHAYITIPTISKLVTEAHPFTMASISQKGDTNELVFMIKGRTGFTSRLREAAALNDTMTVPALIDGPYGAPPDLRAFSTCILIAGGSGITYTLPLLLDIIRRVRSEERIHVRRIKFIWIVRHKESLAWVAKQLQEATEGIPDSLSVDVDFHITSECPAGDDVPGTSSSSSVSIRSEKSRDDNAVGLATGAKILSGRPVFREIIDEEAAASFGPISVDVAGPSSLSSAVRRTVRSGAASPLSALKGLPPIILHVETFGMVKG